MWSSDVHLFRRLKVERCYGLVGRGIDSRIGLKFRHSSSSAFGSSEPSIHGLCVIPGRGEWGRYSGRNMQLTTHPNIAPNLKKKKGKMNVYSPSGPSWPFLESLRLFRKLITCTNVAMWKYCVLISILLDVTEFTALHHYLCCILQVWMHFALKFLQNFYVGFL
jgi:hypothetical protein